jgi:23S rRNA U2552 (ribose-2'-O)-methylase RlmE/FtsJ
MKLTLTPEQAAEVRPWLNQCRQTPTPSVLAGQILPGTYPESPGVVFLQFAIIKPETAKKIRKLVEQERAKSNNGSSSAP